MKAYPTPLFILLLLLTVLPGGLLQAQNASSSGTFTVPTSIPFQAYLVDDYGTPVTTSSAAPLAMRFGIYINNTRIWYAAYSAVNVVGGSFMVDLGGDYNVATGLDPTTGTALSGTLPLPITPGLISTFSTSSTASVQIEISNGDGGYTALSPNVPINSSMFALRADNVGGYEASQLTKTDSNGNIVDTNGDPVISSSGVWLGTGGGPPGPTGSEGEAGPQGDQGPQGQGFTFQGPWIPGTDYSPYDVVTWQGSTWVEVYYPDSDYTPPDEDTVDWNLFAGGLDYLGQFDPNSEAGYYPNDIVTYDGQEWLCINSPECYPYYAPNSDTTDWQVFAGGFSYYQSYAY
ncbi:MAG TPA: hypothetical protein VHY22_13225, partial [Chthoniobacteraceae bacterium]|nr:hypothetical protein [Chthoniobacteraceae bacterium]